MIEKMFNAISIIGGLTRIDREAIIEETRTYESVPKKLKEKVAQALKDLGHEELIL